MGKHLKENEWIKIFEFYKKYITLEITKKEFIQKYKLISKREIFNNYTFYIIKKKLKKI